MQQKESIELSKNPSLTHKAEDDFIHRSPLVSLKWKLIFPLLLVLFIILGYPILFSVWIAFHDYKLTRLFDIKFIGFDNFFLILTDSGFINALSNTVTFVFFAVSFELMIGLTLAILVKHLIYFKQLARVILLVPMFITPIAVGLMFKFLLNSQFGVINELVRIDWFGPDMALFSIVLIDVWQWTPFMFLMCLAGLESLPKSPFEAARVDGASPILIFFSLTLPLLRPVIIVAIIIRILDAFKVFEYIYAITRGGPGNLTETMMFTIYKTGFRFFNMGQAAAMALTLVVIILSFVLVLVFASTPKTPSKIS